jgi:hypothetical protein
MEERFGKDTYTALCFSGREFALEDELRANASKESSRQSKEGVADQKDEDDNAAVAVGTGDEAGGVGETGRHANAGKAGETSRGEANQGMNKRKREAHDQTTSGSDSDTSGDPASKKAKGL